MKTVKTSSVKVIVFALLLAVTIFSCKKTDTTAATTATGTAGVVKANSFGFDGVGAAPFSSTTAGIVKVGNIVTISAIQDGTSNSIRIVLNGVTAAGTFTLNRGNNAGNGGIISKDYNKPADTSLNYSTDNSSGTLIGGGSVTITSLTSTDAEGTFSIVAYNAAGKAAFVEQGTFKGHVN